MDYNGKAAKAELEGVASTLRGHGATARLAGTGAAVFLVVEFGRRGAELYHGDKGYVVDRAEDDTLLGEQLFGSIDDAVDTIRTWLTRD